MCLSVCESRRRKAVPTQWLNESGRVAHPYSPAGRGGPGVFRSPGVFGADDANDLLPHGDSPVSLGVDPGLVAQAENATEQAAVRQPAPKVSKDAKDEQAQKIFTLKLKADKKGVDGLEGGYTDFDAVNHGKITPTPDAAGDKVAKISNTATWVITIQTQYGANNNIEEDAGYGRGTTPEDKAAGNVTLGFHESCHREALLNFFRNSPVPTFTGAVGDSMDDFATKMTAFLDAMDAYFVKAKTDNEAAVDEVGDPTKSAYFAEE